MITDPIADMLSAVKNAVLARCAIVAVPHSRVKESVARVMVNEGYLKNVSVKGSAPKQELVMGIKYLDGMPVVSDIKRRSKPGLRVYVNKRIIPSVSGGMGITIVSTPQGIMTGYEAKKRGLGGELICEIW